MKQINILIVLLMSIFLIPGIATSSDMREKNKKAIASQEEIYRLTNEFKNHKREIHLQREEDRRRKQYRKKIEKKKNWQKDSRVNNKRFLKTA